MDSVLTPYDVLDLSPLSTVPEIKNRYRQLVLMYHPDKCSSSVLKFMSSEYFSKIQDAYKDIMRTRRVDSFPKDVIDYSIDDDIQQEMDVVVKEILEQGDKNWNDVFNKRFEEVHKHFDMLNIHKGYDSFNHNPKDPDTITEQYVPLWTLPKNETINAVKPINEAIVGYGEPMFIQSTLNGDSLIGPSSNALDLGDLGTVWNSEPFKESCDPPHTVDVMLDNKKEERSCDYVIPSKEEAMMALKEQKEREEHLYYKEKSEYETMWEKALAMSKNFLQW